MSYEPNKCLDDLCEMKSIIMCGLKNELANGIQNVNTKEAGDAADIIKDLAEAEKCCLESEYYKAVIMAMGESSEGPYGYMPTVYGYNNRHYGNGRFAPTGSGTRMGYDPTIHQMPYIHEYLDDPEEFSRKMRYGYSETDGRYGRAYNQYQTAKRYYTETHSEKDKNEMTTHAKEHLADTIASMRDIWSMADPEMKKRMKADLTSLVGEMTV